MAVDEVTGRQIEDWREDNPWRKNLQPAMFRNAWFHMEVGGRDSGRRIVLHEFPKRDYPYAEDMGRRARSFSVRGYCIQYPRDAHYPLYLRDYRRSRDLLITALEQEGAGYLQLPTGMHAVNDSIRVVVLRYRVVEEQRFGGFCTFDMEFTEHGFPPFIPQTDIQSDVTIKSETLTSATILSMNNGLRNA
jgi:prophage DNA circulation protein